MRVLVVEDERKIAGFLERGLTDEGHVVDVASDLAQARTALGAHDYDLLLVDRMLPDGDGLSIVRELRREGSSVPTICLTAKDRVEERVEGLYGGADDYIVKPFAFDELLARLRALVRRTKRAGGTSVIRVGDLEVDTTTKNVARAGEAVRLSGKEYAVLECLAFRKGRVVTRDALLGVVYDGDEQPGSNVVEVYIGALRRKIDRDHAVKLIHTRRGLGYVLSETP